MCGFLMNMVVFQDKRGVREKKRKNLKIQIFFEVCNIWQSENIRQFISLGFKRDIRVENIHLGVINI